MYDDTLAVSLNVMKKVLWYIREKAQSLDWAFLLLISFLIPYLKKYYLCKVIWLNYGFRFGAIFIDAWNAGCIVVV